MPKCITLTGRNEHGGIASLWVILMKSCRKGMIETLMKRYGRKTRLAKNYGGRESVNLLLGLVGGPVSLGKSCRVTNSTHSCFLLNYACHLQVRTCVWIIFIEFCFYISTPNGFWMLQLSLLKKYHKNTVSLCVCWIRPWGLPAFDLLPATVFLQHLSVKCSHVLIWACFLLIHSVSEPSRAPWHHWLCSEEGDNEHPAELSNTLAIWKKLLCVLVCVQYCSELTTAT